MKRGPIRPCPRLGASWQLQGEPARQPHAYSRGGTAKLLPLLHPASGTVRARPLTATPNTVLHPWLHAELTAILAGLPALSAEAALVQAERSRWDLWQAGLSAPLPLPDPLPPLRLLLVLDNLAGHKSAALVNGLLAHGIMPLSTPVAGSWLNRAESIQRISVSRALNGQQPETATQVMAWLTATVRGWNAAPTAFAWGGKRAARRARRRARRHALGGSGACTRRPLRRTRAATPGANNGQKLGK